MIKSVFLRVFSTIVAMVMLITVGLPAGADYDVNDPDACVMNFSVLSDVHIEGNNIMRYKVFAKSLHNVKKNKSGNDAIVFLGDNTMNGQHIENMLFHGTVGILLKGENVLPVMGNHDIGNGEGDYNKLQNRWYDYTRAFFGRDLKHPYYYEVIEGCYFIVLGMEAQEVHEMMVTEKQFEWLENVLEKAAASGMPTFVFSHYPADYAVDESGEETSRLVDLFADFNREHDLISFVGHTHMPMHLYWSFKDYDGFPEIYLPRLTSLGGADDDSILDDTGVGVEVELYENEVYVRGRDFYRGEWKVDDWEDEPDTMLEMIYQLKNPVPAQ